MKQQKQFRTNGAVGALLDEYEKALDELIIVIDDLKQEELAMIIDPNTTDEDCKSIQNILSHVVESGYTYVLETRKWLGENIAYRKKIKFSTVPEYKIALREMFAFNEKLFSDHPDLKLEEHDPNKKIHVRWGQKFDVDQLFEHAIMHILRHRRQIERFKELIN